MAEEKNVLYINDKQKAFIKTKIEKEEYEMEAYLNDKKGDLTFHVDHRGLTIAFGSGSNKPTVLNVQEYEICKTRDSLELNEVIVKNHADFQGTVDALIGARVIYKRLVRVIEVGYIKYGVYRLSPDAVKEIYRQNNVMAATG